AGAPRGRQPPYGGPRGTRSEPAPSTERRPRRATQLRSPAPHVTSDWCGRAMRWPLGHVRASVTKAGTPDGRTGLNNRGRAHPCLVSQKIFEISSILASSCSATATSVLDLAPPPPPASLVAS